MQVDYYDGMQELIDAEAFENAVKQREKVGELMEDPAVKSVSLHKAGDEVTMRDGTEYVVQADGSWKRKHPKFSKGSDAVQSV